jgi:hypothetical protein
MTVIFPLFKINEVLRDKPVSRKLSQKLKYAKKNCPGNLARYDEHQKILQGRNSYSKTDPDATFMRMKEGRMRTTLFWKRTKSQLM